MASGTSAVAFLTACLATATGGQELPAHLRELKVDGTWHPTADVAAGAGWQVDGGRLRLDAPAGVDGEWAIRRDEPLPDGGWTVDIWCVQYRDPGWAELELTIGDRESEAGFCLLFVEPGWSRGQVRLYAEWPRHQNYSASERLDGAGGPVLWVRLAHDPETGATWIAANGQPVRMRDGQPQIPTGPLGFRVEVGRSPDRDRTLEVAGFTVGSYTEPPSARVPGPAVRGWEIAPDAAGLQGTEGIAARLAALSADAALSGPARAHALAARALLERTQAGAITDGCWGQVAAFLDAASTDADAALHLLPVLAATCAGTDRADQVAGWTDTVLESAPAAVRPGASGAERLLRRAGLLDPARAAVASLGRKLTPSLVTKWCDDLRADAPELAFSLWCGQSSEADLKARQAGITWLLPEIRKTAPNYPTLMTDYLRDLGAHNDGPGEEPDRTLSFAAYRLAPIEPETAMDLWRSIAAPEVKATTLDHMADGMAGADATELDRLIEVSFKRAIADFTPSKRRDSPVHLLLRLADWYVSRERTDEAASVLRDASGKRGQTPQVRFSDAFGICRRMRDLDLPEAEELWPEAVETGKALDAAYTGPEHGGIVYIAATTVIVRELMQRGRLEEALTAAQTLPLHLPMNRSNCFAAIIREVVEDDPARALELLPEVTFDKVRPGLISELAVRLAPTDRAKALELIRELPEMGQKAQRLRIARATDEEWTEELARLQAEVLAHGVRAVANRPDKWSVRNYSLRVLLELGPPELDSAADALAEDPEMLAHQLLASVVTWAGLAETDLWRRYDASYGHELWSIPWGVAHLEDAIRAQEGE